MSAPRLESVLVYEFFNLLLRRITGDGIAFLNETDQLFLLAFRLQILIFRQLAPSNLGVTDMLLLLALDLICTGCFHDSFLP